MNLEKVGWVRGMDIGASGCQGVYQGRKERAFQAEEIEETKGQGKKEDMAGLKKRNSVSQGRESVRDV